MEVYRLPSGDGAMGEITSQNISSYLLRPLRKLEEVLAQQEKDQRREIRSAAGEAGSAEAPQDRFAVILGGKR